MGKKSAAKPARRPWTPGVKSEKGDIGPALLILLVFIGLPTLLCGIFASWGVVGAVYGGMLKVIVAIISFLPHLTGGG